MKESRKLNYLHKSSMSALQVSCLFACFALLDEVREKFLAGKQANK